MSNVRSASRGHTTGRTGRSYLRAKSNRAGRVPDTRKSRRCHSPSTNSPHRPAAASPGQAGGARKPCHSPTSPLDVALAGSARRAHGPEFVQFRSVPPVQASMGGRPKAHKSWHHTACLVGSCKSRYRQIPRPARQLKPAGQPSDRPIQLACMRRTFSGQRVSPSSAPSRSSEKSEIFKNHWVRRAARRPHPTASPCRQSPVRLPERCVNRIPIDNAFAPVNKAGLKKIKKHGLFVA